MSRQLAATCLYARPSGAERLDEPRDEPCRLLARQAREKQRQRVVPLRDLGSFKKHRQEVVFDIGQALTGQELLEREVIKAGGVVAASQKQAAL